MESPLTNEETPTRRMGASVNSAPPSEPEAPTRRMVSAAGTDVNQENIPTQHIAAVLPRAGTNSIAPGNRSGSLGALEPGTVICGNCTVIRTYHNHESGRPGLFECQAPEGHVMVKVAATDFPPSHELWNKLPTLSHNHVLRTFRVHEENGRFYEVQEFCTGGTLAEFVPSADSTRGTPSADWVEKSLVPAFQSGISYLHSMGIVHRDIKPANIYLREQNGRKTLVIGDFDISSVLQTGRTSRATQRVAATWIYSPPEGFPRFIDEGASQLGTAVVRSSDYYSLGVVIIELLMGTTSLHQAELPDLYEFYLQGGRVEIPANLPTRLTELLGGLLCRNRHKRWGDEEVARWLAHQTTDSDRQRIADDRGYQLGRTVAPFTAFDSIKATSLAELSRAMNAEPRVALEELMSSDVMLNWIGQLDARLARLIRQDREKWRAQPRLALLCARLHLDPNAPFPIDSQRQACSAEEWANLAQAAFAQGTSTYAALCHPSALGELEMWLRRKATPEVDAAERVVQILKWHHSSTSNGLSNTSHPVQGQPQTSNVTTPNPAVVFAELCYAFLPNIPYPLATNVSARTPQQIVQLTLGDAGQWSDKPPGHYLVAMRRWQDGFLEAYLRQRLTSESGAPSPLLRQMEKVRRDFPQKPFAAFETILRLLDPKLPLLEIEFDAAALQHIWEVNYGQQASRTIAFRTVGAGMPIAALQLHNQWTGLQLETHEISQRNGQIELKIFSQGDIPVGREFEAQLLLVGSTTRLAGDNASLRYKVSYPKSQTATKVLIGSVIGAVLLGGLRAAVLPVAPAVLEPSTAFWLGRGSWVVLFGGLALTFYVACRIWLWAMARYAR